MVSEGVDIPRLRVGVYATAAKTPLIFRQIVGRFVRTTPGREPEPSWLYLPADGVLRAHAADVERELRHVLRPPSEDEGGLDEIVVRRESEPSEMLDFQPVAADVAPQLALFGAPAGAVAAAPPVAPRKAPDPAPMAAFERRALLRDKRKRLVGELSRRDGRSHAEVNAWLNREVGIGRVGDATLDQLERACDLLLRALTGR